MKNLILSASLLFLIGDSAAFSQGEKLGSHGHATETVFPPEHARLDNMEIRIHSGANKTIVDGINYIDTPHNMQCKSAAGCIISIQGAITINSGQFLVNLYSTVDGVEVRPPWPTQYNEGAPIVTLQNAVVGQGNHAVQSIVNCTCSNYALPVTAWQINYTLYEKGAH